MQAIPGVRESRNRGHHVAASLCALALAACAHGDATSGRDPGGAASTTEAPSSAIRSDAPLKISTPAKMMKWLEDSPRSYALESAPPDEFRPRKVIEGFWPNRRPFVNHPVVRVDRGQRVVVGAALDARASAILERAEKEYEAKRFAEAGRIAQAAAEIAPDSHIVWLYLGDCALFAGDAEGALRHYERARRLNDLDYQVHFFTSTALVRLGRMAEARESFARALAAKPRHETLVERIIADERFDFTVAPDVIAPQVTVTPKPDGATIRVSSDHMEWLAYGVCKALWEHEPEYRASKLGDARRIFSSAEEVECLLGVLTTYQRLREEGETKPDPALDRLARIVEEGHLGALVLYELASRVDPNIAVVADDATREALVRYVRAHVLVPRPRKEDVPGDRPRGGDGQLHGGLLDLTGQQTSRQNRRAAPWAAR